jgi:type I restriction enzyme S subunit
MSDTPNSHLSSLNPQPMSHGYKRTEVGVIPEDWRAEYLDECVQPDAPICYGILMPGEHCNHGVPVVKVRDILGGRIDESNLLLTRPSIDEAYKRSRLCSGDVLITIRGTTGRVAIVTKELHGANITQDTARVRINPNESNEFVYYALQSQPVQQQVALHTIGQAVKGINIRDVRTLVIPLPPTLHEQHAIAEALSDVDGLLGGLDQLIAKKRDLKQAAMQQLLTGQTRLPGEWKIKPGYKQTEVGMIPQDWEVKLLKKFASVKGGKRLPIGKSLTDKPNSHPYIRVSDMRPGGIDIHDIKYVPDDVFPAIRNYRIYSSDLFISVAGSLGIVGRIPPELNGANLTENADKITEIACDRGFLLYNLLSDRIQASIDSVRTIGAQPKLALGQIENFKFALPPTEAEQIAIAAVLSDMDAELAALERRREKTRTLKQAMMQELLTGKTRLT